MVPTEKTYEASTFAEKLGVSSSTLRNYKSQFSKANVTFRNYKGKTIYTENDLVLFNKMLNLHKGGGQTIKQCVHAVLSVQDSMDGQDGQDNAQDNQNSKQDKHESFQESAITFKQYEDIIKRLEIQEQELQKYKAQVERRDRQVTELMRQMQELRKQTCYKKAWWMFWKN
ncbi:MerR family transcriptional regulator [Priestia megaterium]|uniref:MerR family transcriptional regulator n=1 Tax=Priestia megaterium TaxID=1404 RepID=UPI001E529FFB|nr:MerR family transcriptional regulator [Priestia megaterium]